MKIATRRITAAWLLLVAAPFAPAQERVPGEVWLRFESPEEAGFSSVELAKAKAYYDTLDAAAAMVVFDGAVLAAWGDVGRRFMCHSMRKSVMSAAWGVHVDRGEVDLSRTLAELGIDDLEPKLTETEKKATILDLLMARSGVYRLAAYEPPQNPKPPRHSHEPGTFFCYNNWDFNALLTIFEQETGADFFVDVHESLAVPIGMEDFRPRDGYRHYEPDKSIHPAYPLKLTARDLARFGTLFLREGQWGEVQVLSKSWVDRSRTSYSDAGGGRGYGLLWWIEGEEDLAALGMYSALGYGGHAVDVLPGANFVLVFRVNTFDGKSVSSGRRKQLLRKILAARVGEPKEEPVLVELEPSPSQRVIPDVAIDVGTYTGTVFVPPFGLAKVSVAEDGRLVIGLPGRDTFDLVPLGDDHFLIADLEHEVAFDRDADGRIVGMIHPVQSSEIAARLLEAGSVDEARKLAEKILEHFPDAAGAREVLERTLLPAPPNIILVFIDDMGWTDLSCFGNEEAMTPRIDALAAEGLAFEQFYVNAPICSPSRVAISTGQYPQRWRITSYLDNRRSNAARGVANWLEPTAPMLARSLKAAGYATGHFGKWHMGGQRDVDDAPPIRGYGFDESLTNFEGMGAKLLPLTMRPGETEPGRIWQDAERLGGPVTWMQRSRITGGYVDAALAFIDRAVAEGKPFYVNVWPDDVHSPFWPPVEKWREEKRPRYLAVLEEMDRQLGVLFDHVRESEALRGNTLIVLCSDNGPEHGAGSSSPLRGSKGTLYEGGVRSPLIVWGSGFLADGARGTRNTTSVLAAIDLVPSLLDFTGVEAQAGVEYDGEAHLATLLGRSTDSREAPLCFSRPPDHASHSDTGELPDLAVRRGRWKLLCEYDGSEPQLYDLLADPIESVDLAAAKPELTRELVEVVTGWYRSMP